jgi:hypothetical protein
MMHQLWSGFKWQQKFFFRQTRRGGPASKPAEQFREGGNVDCQHVSDWSLHNLEELITSSRSRGEMYFAALLEGVKMYVLTGREFELLEIMRRFEREIRPAVEGTPSIGEMEALYRRESEERTSE